MLFVAFILIVVLALIGIGGVFYFLGEVAWGDCDNVTLNSEEWEIIDSENGVLKYTGKSTFEHMHKCSDNELVLDSGNVGLTIKCPECCGVEDFDNNCKFWEINGDEIKYIGNKLFDVNIRKIAKGYVGIGYSRKKGNSTTAINIGDKDDCNECW
jgi:hypothetical protein